MNERIYLLAEQAGLYTKLNEKPWPTAMSAEQCNEAYSKFAELIVRECAEIASVSQAEDMGWDISEIIKEHFSVE